MGILEITATIESLNKKRTRTFAIPDSGIFRVAATFAKKQIIHPDGTIETIIQDVGGAYDSWVDWVLEISKNRIRAFEEQEALARVSDLPISEQIPDPPPPDPPPPDPNTP